MKAHALVLVAAVLAMGCSTAIALTEGGQRVRHGERADMPPGCRLVSDVRIGIPPDAAMPATEEELVILMRNKTHTQGGNFVIVESTEQRDTNNDGEVFYRGRGTSYACPAPEPEATPASDEGGTAGGDDGEAPVEDGEGGSDTSSEDDAILDDLLSD